MQDRLQLRRFMEGTVQEKFSFLSKASMLLSRVWRAIRGSSTEIPPPEPARSRLLEIPSPKVDDLAFRKAFRSYAMNSKVLAKVYSDIEEGYQRSGKCTVKLLLEKRAETASAYQKLSKGKGEKRDRKMVLGEMPIEHLSQRKRNDISSDNDNMVDINSCTEESLELKANMDKIQKILKQQRTEREATLATVKKRYPGTSLHSSPKRTLGKSTAASFKSFSQSKPAKIAKKPNELLKQSEESMARKFEEMAQQLTEIISEKIQSALEKTECEPKKDPFLEDEGFIYFPEECTPKLFTLPEPVPEDPDEDPELSKPINRQLAVDAEPEVNTIIVPGSDNSIETKNCKEEEKVTFNTTEIGKVIIAGTRLSERNPFLDLETTVPYQLFGAPTFYAPFQSEAVPFAVSLRDSVTKVPLAFPKPASDVAMASQHSVEPQLTETRTFLNQQVANFGARISHPPPASTWDHPDLFGSGIDRPNKQGKENDPDLFCTRNLRGGRR